MIKRQRLLLLSILGFFATSAAHAWVEHSGVVVNDDPEVTSGYTPLSGVTAKTFP